MKSYSIYYHFDRENYIVRSVSADDAYDPGIVLHEYAKGDYQTFSEGPGSLTCVNMSNIAYTKIYEID